MHRSSKVDAAPGSAGPGQANWLVFGWLLGLAQLLLHGSLGLVLFWVLYYRGGFGWRDEPKLEFNYHPVLMIGGFVYLAGNGESRSLCRNYVTSRENVRSSNFTAVKLDHSTNLCIKAKFRCIAFKVLNAFLSI